MGDKVVSDLALSCHLVMQLKKDLEVDFTEASSGAEKDQVALFATLLLFSYFAGLRGEKIMLADTAGFFKYVDVGKVDKDVPHVVVPLLGRLKGETGKQCHIISVVKKTSSK